MANERSGSSDAASASRLSYRELRVESEHPQTWGDGFGVLLDDRAVCLLLDALTALRGSPCERALHGIPECGTDPEADRLGWCGRCMVLHQFDDEGWEVG